MGVCVLLDDSLMSEIAAVSFVMPQLLVGYSKIAVRFIALVAVCRINPTATVGPHPKLRHYVIMLFRIAKQTGIGFEEF